MRRLSTLLLLTTLAFAPAAHAADKGVDPAVTAARAMMPKSQWDQMWTAMSESQRQMLAQMGGDAKADAMMDKLTSRLKALMPYEEMVDLQAGLLKKYYTPAEIKELERFYTSPLGQKSLRTAPEMMRDVMGSVQQRIVSEMPKIMQELAAEAGE